MRYLAFASIAAIFLLFFTVLWYLGNYGVDESVDTETFFLGPGGASVFTYMNTINIIVFAYNNQFNVPQLTGELTPQPSTRRMTIVAYISTALSFCLYVLVSLFGVLAFGVADNQKQTLILDLSPARNVLLVQVTLAAVMFSVLTCFQFHIYPVRQFMAYVVRKLRRRKANDEASDTHHCGITMTRWIDIACAILSVAFAVVVAVVISELKPILDFIGGFASAWISYVIPPLFIIQIRRHAPGFSWMKIDIVLTLVFFLLGVFLFVFGTYSAIVG
jgi:amino acid permease